VNAVFALSALVAVAATIMVITRRNAVHALLYLVVSLLAVAVIMLLLGAAFVAALEGADRPDPRSRRRRALRGMLPLLRRVSRGLHRPAGAHR
jgi:hypothetical protein